MKNAQVEKIPRPPKELRDQTRRNQILEAARVCVVRHGFHAASMADIAQTAAMSVGQIYRYFPNKDAIIHGIVEHIVEERLKWMVALDMPPAKFALFVAKNLVAGAHESRDDRVLMLEVMAEATRSPAVAQILREADARLRSKGLELLRLTHPDMAEHKARGKVELLAALAEGTAMRRVTGLLGDKERVTEVYREVLEGMLSAS